MKKNLPRFNFFKKLFLSFFIFIFLFNFVFLSDVHAQLIGAGMGDNLFGYSAIDSNLNFGFPKLLGGKPTMDASKIAQDFEQKTEEDRKSWWQRNKDKWWAKATFNILSSVANRVAYETAVILGTAGGGQKPLWEKDYLMKVVTDMGEVAASEFLDQLGREWNYNFCEPDLSIKVRIGGGLISPYQPQAPKCGFRELQATFKDQYAKWEAYAEDPWKFVDGAVSALNPRASDIGITMGLLDDIQEAQEKEEDKIKTELTVSSGWLDIRNIGGKRDNPPEWQKRRADRVDKIATDSMQQRFGDIGIDAANIFTNQVLLSFFDSALKSYSDWRQDNTKKPWAWLRKNEDSSNSPDLRDKDEDPYSYSRASLTEDLRQILTFQSTEKTDYSVLTELLSCSNTTNYTGPNNCVIGQSFSRAIENKSTLIEAVESGLISTGMIFTEKGDYQNTLNRRSLMILRKFRVIPVSWEEALDRIIEEQKKKFGQGQYTIMDMISCFDPNDEYDQFSKNFPYNTDKNSGELEWCQGLIDPHWVLKIPRNYCARQGYGGHILSTQVISIPGTTLGEVTNPGVNTISVVRNDTYCADERSCIKEAGDGSCQFYGYCTEEKRTWNFSSNSCPAVYNTCQSFTSSSGKRLALLKNTIQYDPCSADNAGCGVYSILASISKDVDGTFKISKLLWGAEDRFINFNKKVETCSAGSEACHEFIRTKSGFGHNFITNGDFESSGGWPQNYYTHDKRIKSGFGYNGSVGIRFGYGEIIGSSALVGPDSSYLKGETFTLSFYSKCSATSTAFMADMPIDSYKTISPSEDFIYQSFSYTYPDNYSGSASVDFKVKAGPEADCYLDNFKLERGTVGTFYSNYRDDGLVYFKTIPEYLKNACYKDPNNSTNPNFSLRENAPKECYNYARLCNFDELSCDLFKMADGRSVPAKALDKDYCPAECDGYNVYVQKDTIFEESAYYKFIPTTAQKCSADNVGCSEFTNLEDLSGGGERIEYYSYLRQCIKPDEGTCANFYSWEGNDESGYQLRSFSLAVNTLESGQVSGGSLSLTAGELVSAGNKAYKHKIGDIEVCNSEIVKMSPADPRYNSDCREMYDQGGNIIYVLYSKTKTCSNNCKLYRMTERNINKDIKNATECNALNPVNKTIAKWTKSITNYDQTIGGGEESASSGYYVCYHCLNGGVWDDTQEACVYKAIPGEGKTCSASQKQCREYTGNIANNIRIIDSYDFEENLSGWQGGSESTESLSNNGSSMKLNPPPSGGFSASTSQFKSNKTISGLVKGRSYLVSFLGKTDVENSDESSSLKIYFTNSKEEKTYFKVINSSGQSDENIVINGFEWQVYKISLDSLDFDIDSTEKIVIENTDRFNKYNIYIDDLILSESANRYYLIKDSWKTPNICYYDQNSNKQGVNYNLGCSAYLDRANNKHYLRQFTKLCDESAVGCELMIDTHNYSPKEGAVFLAGEKRDDLNSCPVDNTRDCVQIPQDNFVSVVYDNAKLCNSADKGCSLFGKVIANLYGEPSEYIYQDVYLKNNPDKYENGILCAQDEIGCEAWSSAEGDSYFKDPMDNICQFTKNSWYVKKIKRCLPKNGAVAGNDIYIAGEGGITPPKACNNNLDCHSLGSNFECKLDENNYLCPINKINKNITEIKTIGNEGNLVEQPMKWGEEGGTEIYWTGLCPLKESGCTEYIDPESTFNSNLVYNPKFSDLNGDTIFFDGWVPADPYDQFTAELFKPKKPTSGSGSLYTYNNSTYELIGDVHDALYGTGGGQSGGNSPQYYFVEQPAYHIEKHKLYAIKSENVESWEIKCNKKFYELNSENKIIPIAYNPYTNNEGSLYPPSNPSFPYYKSVQNLGTNASKFIFYSAENDLESDCSLLIKVHHQTPIENIVLEWRELVVDYKIKSDLDFSSCNYPDFDQGCVIFNERSLVTGGYPNFRTLNYDSRDYSNYTPQGDNVYKDANQIIKVIPDRDCGKWLSCHTYTTEKDNKGKEKNVCLQIAQCTSMDNSGNCTNFSKAVDGNRVFDSAKDANASGYSLLNHYHLDAMVQRTSDYVFNEDFEKPSLAGWFINSSIASSSCLISKSADTKKGLEDPYHSRYDVYPSPSNLAFVVMGGIGNCGGVWKKNLDTSIGANYFLNFLINTSNLTPPSVSGEVVLAEIKGRDLNDNEVDGVDIKVNVHNKNWQRISIQFTPPNSWTKGSKIVFYPRGKDNSISGFIYVDDINIGPVLEIGEEGQDKKKYISPTCRLYPSQDSLSCFKETQGYAGVIQGWEGYCLQKDPHNGNVCLLWYPVDTISGSNVGGLTTGFSGYPSTGATPYYCAQMDANFDLVERRDIYFTGMKIGGLPSGTIYPNYSYSYVTKYHNNSEGDDNGHFKCNNDYYTFSNRIVSTEDFAPQGVKPPGYNNPSTNIIVFYCYLAFLRQEYLPGQPFKFGDIYYHEVYYCIPRSDAGYLIIPISTYDNYGGSKSKGGRSFYAGSIKISELTHKTGTNDGIPIACGSYTGDNQYCNDGNDNMSKCCDTYCPSLCFHKNCNRNDDVRSIWKFFVKPPEYFESNPSESLGWPYNENLVPYKGRAGWYKYDGTINDKNIRKVGSPSNPEEDIRILAYNIHRNDCISGVYDYFKEGEGENEQDINIPAEFFPRGNGIAQCPIEKCTDEGSNMGACLMHPSMYTPKCKHIVKGEAPWATRLMPSNSLSKLSLRQYFDVFRPTFIYGDSYFPVKEGVVGLLNKAEIQRLNRHDFTYLDEYVLGSNNPPYGAINSMDEPENVNTNNLENNISFGLPLFCSGYWNIYNRFEGDNYDYYGFDYYGFPIPPPDNKKWIDSCTALYYDRESKKIRYDDTNNDIGKGHRFISTSYSESAKKALIESALKNIFIKTNDYDYTATSNTRIPPCNQGSDKAGCPPRPKVTITGTENVSVNSTELGAAFCAIYPQIKNIKLSGPIGEIPQTASGSNVYRISRGGFYTLSFNTEIDADQAPIKRLIVQIKDIDASWSESNNIDLGNLDHRPKEDEPHHFTKFLPAGDYIVVIKVIDNWDFYKCAGIGAFYRNDNNNCYRYCCGAPGISYGSDQNYYFNNPFSEDGCDNEHLRCSKNEDSDHIKGSPITTCNP